MKDYSREELKAKIKVIQDACSRYANSTVGQGLGELRYLLLLSYLERIESLLEKLVGGDFDEKIS